MIASSISHGLTESDRAALERAVKQLEQASLAMKVADIAGQPVNRVLSMLPRQVSRRVTKPLEKAIFRCLEIAIGSLEDPVDEGGPAVTPDWMPRVMAGMTGAVAGFFGAVTLPLELPLTTTLILRSIAEIARQHGEDVRDIEAGLACLEVFAFSGPRTPHRADLGYYATRAVTAKLAADVTALAMRQGGVNAASPAAMRLVAEVAQRFGVALSERAVAGAVPILGAVGGATVNLIFMQHFQTLADGHFAIRRLERVYGEAVIRAEYRLVADSHEGRRAFDRLI
jgi:hypothetical protein